MGQVQVQHKQREILLVQPSEDGQQVIHVATDQVNTLVEQLLEKKTQLDAADPASHAKEAREDSFGAL